MTRSPEIAIDVASAAGSPYPEPFSDYSSSSAFRQLADQFELEQIGVNLVTLEPGEQSGLRHWHTLEDEFIYVLEGEITLQLEFGLHVLTRVACYGFKAGDQNGHLSKNASTKTAHYLIIGSRRVGDVAI